MNIRSAITSPRLLGTTPLQPLHSTCMDGDGRQPSDNSRSSAESSTIDRIEDIERSMEQLAMIREHSSARGRLPPRTDSLRLAYLAGRGASPNLRVHAGRRAAAAAALPSRPVARLSDTSSSSSRHSTSDSERYSGRDVPARPREVSTADRECQRLSSAARCTSLTTPGSLPTIAAA